jgi:hypothetical protein
MMHTFKINGVPSDASLFPQPQWLNDFMSQKGIKRFTLNVNFGGTQVIGIIPQVEQELQKRGATQWFANWSGKVTPNTLVSVSYL